jgi:transcriptional activator of cad operon
MNSFEKHAFHIGACHVNAILDEIYKGDITIKLEPRTMRLLVCLAENAGNVVSIDQLLGSNQRMPFG